MERDRELGDTVLHKAGYLIREAIEAAVQFVERGGDRAVVCLPEFVVEAFEGRAGTVEFIEHLIPQVRS